jgi:hypothetical protein
LEARVEVLEQLGSEMLAEVLIGEARLTIAPRRSAGEPRPGRRNQACRAA